jgi:predicted dehydrogenase
MTTDDQIAVTGVLEGGAVASLHFRGGESAATALRWEINGTEGDLLITGDLGYLHLGRVTIRGAQRQGSALTELAVPARYHLLPELMDQQAEPFYGVANAYARLRSDLAEGTERVPTFAAAVERHRLLDRIEQAARTGASA